MFSHTAGREFDFGASRPGASGRRSFAKPSTIEVECALRPQMKRTVEAKP